MKESETKQAPISETTQAPISETAQEPMTETMQVPMTVGFDGKRAVRNGTGLGNYSRYAIDTLSRHYPALQLNVYASGGPGRLLLTPANANMHIVAPAGLIGRRLPGLWRLDGMARQAADDGAAVFHGLSNELPADSGALPSVVTVHDVIWRRYPRDYKFIDRKLYDAKYGSSMRRADRVIAISECTARDIQSDFGIPAEKIDIIHQGIDPQFGSVDVATVSAVRAKYHLPGRYIAAVGTVQGRKNQLLAVKALRALPLDLHLVIVGRRTDYATQIDDYARRHGLTDRIVWLQGVPFSDLAAIYAGAEVTSYPSRYEGFGLPIAESIACGTPVVAATGSCLEEAGGPGALYVDPDDDEAFAHNVRLITDDSALRARMIAAGQEYAKRFNTATFATETMRSYLRAIESYKQNKR